MPISELLAVGLRVKISERVSYAYPLLSKPITPELCAQVKFLQLGKLPLHSPSFKNVDIHEDTVAFSGAPAAGKA
jgi:hypothetical protein